MAWGDWMMIKLPIEEELKLERSVRELMAQIQDEKTSRFCGSMLKQLYFQQKLLQQATHHIAALELEQELSCRPQRPSLLVRVGRWLTS